MIQKLCTPHNVNAFAMKFAQAIIEEPGMIDELVKKQLEGKKYLINQLKDNNYTFNHGDGNFIFIKPKTDTNQIVNNMKNKKNILIKQYNGIGKLGNCLKVNTREKEPMEKFIKALIELDK